MLFGVLVAACAVRPARGELIEADVVVPREGAKSLGAALSMRAGRVAVHGGECALMEGKLRYDSATSRPTIDYAVDGDGFGKLTVSETNARAGRPADWTVCLTRDLPLSIEIDLGAGDSTLDFAGVQLRELEVNVGAGNVHVDLRRAILARSAVSINGGAGEMRLTLPTDVGIKVEIDRALGELSIAEGLRRHDDAYVNDLWGRSERSVEVHLDLGVGEISVDLE
jgi:hypothetical protein